MNHFFRVVSCLALLLSFGCVQANKSCRSETATPYFSNRSQSFDGARFLVGWTNFINLCDKDCIYGVFGVTLEGSRSFDSDALAECIFGKDVCNFGSPCCNPTNCCPSSNCDRVPLRSSNKGGCCPSSSCCEQSCCFDCDSRSIVITGSGVENRGKHDWLGDYFGLPSNHKSAIAIKPRVTNFLTDFSLYVGLEEWTCLSGTFFWIRGPIVHTRWDLNLCEEVCCSNTCSPYPAGYYCQDEVPCENLLCRATDFLSNEQTPGTNCGDCSVCFEPLKNSKLSKCKLTETGFADLRFALGWNFLQCCDYHIGAALAVAAPTGTRPEGEFLFEPIIGNGKHWELGAYLTSHYTFWRSCDEDSSFGLYVDAYLMHMFRTRQRRSFDLCGRPNSRYMLAEKLGTPVEHLFTNEKPGDQSGSVAPIAQFKSVFTPVANLTTFDVKVSSGIQANVVAMFNYTNCGFTLDFGYEFWGRSCEKIDYDCDCAFPLAENTWALKGDSYVFGFAQTSTGGVSQNDPIALSATQSCATIHTGLNALGNDQGLRTSRNPNVDNAQYARIVADATPNANILDRKTTSGGLQTKSSNQPVFISRCDIDLEGAATRGISNAVFAHLSYAWRDCEDWIPYVGVGGKAEFGPRGDNCCDVGCNTNCPQTACDTACATDCDGCKKCNLSQWAVWVKGGIAFN